MNILGIALLLLQVQLGSVSGMVTKPGGTEPLQGAAVTLNPVVSSQPSRIHSTRSEDDGRFTLPELEPGDYRLQVQSSQYGIVDYGQRKPNGPGVILTIGPGQRLSDLKISMVPTGTIAGRIQGRNGEPLAYATVQALKYVYRDGKRILALEQSTSTDDRGEYRLFWLTSGKYVVVAGLRSSSSTSLITPRQPGQTVPTLPAGMLGLRGMPSDALLEGSNLTKRIVEDGTIQEESWVPTYYPATTDRTQAASIDLHVGAAITGIDITLGPSPVQKIRGRVTGLPPGTGSRPVTVTLAAATQGVNGQIWIKTPSIIDGTFEFAGVLPGVYFLSAQDRGGLVSRQTPVLVGDRDVDNLAIALEPLITLTVKITVDGAQGQLNPPAPLAGTLVPDIDSLQGGSAANVRSPNIMLGSGNVMALSAPPGDYQFNIGSTVLNVDGVLRENGSSFYVKSMRLGREDALNGFHLASSTTDVLEIVLATQVGSVSGIAVSRTGDPAANVTVVLAPTNARKRLSLYQAVVTGNDGKFRFQGIPPGDYKLFAWDDIENGAWQNSEFMRRYESRGRAIRVSENSRDEVQLTVIDNP